MRKDVISVIATGIEVGSIILLGAIGLKRNNDCYKAELAQIDAERELFATQVMSVVKDAEIETLKKEVEELKKSKEEKEA